ncbi:hypothetical protein [Desulfofundulus sp. TPOSR]|uniref:hypothetical protein n=1 Tax=Desulfofundulus sp. TPOSR TaxID=2714340 RepID=UPI0028BEEEFD|nr:hypothetical protein [Desulfofundulus sp. TPOSR]
MVGLPVAYYRLQKEELRKQLEALHAKVSVDDGPLARVSFGKVVVYPPGGWSAVDGLRPAGEQSNMPRGRGFQNHGLRTG